MVAQGPALAKSAQELLGEFVRTGRQEPFEEIVRRYAGMVFSVCLQILRDTHDAEDATQAVFLTLAVKSKTDDGIKYLAPWLQKVAQRLALDVKRSKTRRKAREERHSDMHRDGNGNGNDHTHQLGLDEVKMILRDELDKLPAKYRLPLILYYFGGLKPEEMSRELGCKPSTLGVRLHRGRKLLAESMANRGIVVSGTLLGVAIAAVVQGSVAEHLIQQTSYAAMQAAAGHELGAGLSAQVLGYNRLATHGLFLAKLKAAIAAAVLLASAAAGATELVGRVHPMGLNVDLVAQLKSLLAPLLHTLARPFRVADAQPAIVHETDLTNAPGGIISLQSLSNDILIPASPLTVGSTPPQPESSIASNSGFGSPGAAVDIAHIQQNFAPNLAVKPGIPRLNLPWRVIPSAVSASAEPSTTSGTATEISSDAPSASAQPTLAASDQSLALGGAFGSNEHVTWSSPEPVTLRKLSIGGQGFASFHMAAGQIHADKVVVGESKGGVGNLAITGASSVRSDTMTIGAKGTGNVVQDGDQSVVSADRLIVGEDGSGTYTLLAGNLREQTLVIGVRGDGTVNQLGGVNQVSAPVRAAGMAPTASDYPLDGALHIAKKIGAEGTYELRNGSFSADNEVVGLEGYATLKQLGGYNTTNSIRLGATLAGQGTYKLAAGSVNLPRSEDPFHVGLVVGGTGTGLLKIGTPHSTGNISESGKGAPVAMVVREDENGSGHVHGYGKINLSGQLEQNGMVVADGFGQDRNLDLSSFSLVSNSIDNQPGQTNGWFARHGGALSLPPMTITAPSSINTWGEDSSDNQLDLINSVRFDFHGVEHPGQYAVQLLATDRHDIPAAPPGIKFANVWRTNAPDSGADQMNVTLRYDDSIYNGVAPDDVKFWTFDQGWTQLSSDVNVDFSDALLSATLKPTNFFAVSTTWNSSQAAPPAIIAAPVGANSVPEPGILGLLSLCGGALLMRRRRTHSSK